MFDIFEQVSDEDMLGPEPEEVSEVRGYVVRHPRYEEFTWQEIRHYLRTLLNDWDGELNSRAEAASLDAMGPASYYGAHQRWD